MPVPETNLEVVRELLRRFSARDPEGALALVAPDVVWDTSRLPRFEMVAGVYRGHEGVLKWWTEWLSAWESTEFEHEKHEAIGDGVMVQTHFSGVGRSSGIEVDVPSYWALYDVVDGAVTRIRFFEDRDSAVAAAQPD